MGNRKVVLQHPAYSDMVRAVGQLARTKNVKDVPDSAVYLIDNASALMRSSINVLMESDPLKHDMGLILLYLIDATEERMDNVDGDLTKTYEITDEYLFGCALKKAHSLAPKFRGTE